MPLSAGDRAGPCEIAAPIGADGTGSGQTTERHALSRFMPQEERMVTVEDTAEVQLQRGRVSGNPLPHWTFAAVVTLIRQAGPS
jgi:hypothetical protein